MKEGEQAVNITGLTIADSSTGLPSAIEPGSIKAPESWWTRTLDEFFGVVANTPEASPYKSEVIPGL